MIDRYDILESILDNKIDEINKTDMKKIIEDLLKALKSSISTFEETYDLEVGPINYSEAIDYCLGKNNQNNDYIKRKLLKDNDKD